MDKLERGIVPAYRWNESFHMLIDALKLFSGDLVEKEIRFDISNGFPW